MPIVVDSSQWTGEHDDAPLAGPVVWGEFADARRSTARRSGCRRESLVPRGPRGDRGHAARPRRQRSQVMRRTRTRKGADRRNLRQNFVGIGTAATSMAAAGIVIATGGAALPAVAAAAAAGGATLAAGRGSRGGGAADRHRPPAGGSGGGDAQAEGPALGISAATEAVREQAQAFLQHAGAKRVWVQETAAG